MKTYYAQLGDKYATRIKCRSYVAACEVLDQRQPHFADRGFVTHTAPGAGRLLLNIVRHASEYEAAQQEAHWESRTESTNA